MFERDYQQRLEADLARWQADGVITASAAESIRGRLQPVADGITVATVVAIVGGLLIAAAFLAFIAANWTAIARPTRFGILLAGIAGAYVLGALFDRAGRIYLADLAAAVGAIIFGAAIALVGQMYHLGEDFAGGLLLWAAGALIAAALTTSRGALAVALAAACLWSGTRVFEASDVHFQFAAFWLIAAVLAVIWSFPVARHLVAVAAVVWWVLCAFGIEQARAGNPLFAFCAGSSLMLGAGLAMAALRQERLRAFGLTLSNYGAIALAIALACSIVDVNWLRRGLPIWLIGCGAAGFVLACVGAALNRRVGTALGGLSIGLALLAVSGWVRPSGLQEPWVIYALALGSMLSLVISGMLDGERPRVAAGWIGLAAVIAAITWAVKGSLLRRAAFLAAAGIVAVGLASVLGRLLGNVRGGKERLARQRLGEEQAR
ncbi:MAG: hypothetical protein QOI12_1447 [Alphaproteobacteria bacterium]|jgi:uncharacterized membrane protein|nr:hypothetical protein [Alphaproteobacteria bacterium]